MLEPSITVTNIDQTTNLAADPVDNRLNILCPVISPSGPLELTRVSGPSEFKRLFFGGKGISANDETSAIFARSLVAEAPIWIKRAARNTMRAGITSGTGSPVYVDENLQPITGSKVTFVAPDHVTVEEAFNAWLEEKENGIVKKGNVIYTQDSTLTSSLSWVKNVSTKNIQTMITFTAGSGQGTAGSVDVVIGDLRVILDANTTNLDTLLGYLHANGMDPQYYVGTGDLIDDELPTNVTTIGWIAPLGVSIVTHATGDEAIISANTSPSATVNCVTLKTETENVETYEMDPSPSFKFNYSGTSYVYYCGDSYEGQASIKYQLLAEPNPTYAEFLSALVHALATDFHAGTCGTDSIILPGATEISLTGFDADSSSIQSVNAAIDSEKFAIISRFPCATPLLTARLSADGDIYQLAVTYQDIQETWNFGFDASLVDGYGNSMYYDRVNNDSELIYIVELNGESVTPGLYKAFGNEVTSDYTDVSDVVSALESIPENDEAESYFDFITDAGIVDSTLTATIQNLCDKYFSYYVPSCAPTLTESEVLARRSSIGSHFRSEFIAQTQRDTTVDAGSVILPASFYYLRRRIELGNTAQEFMALFGSNQGDIGMDAPIQKWTRAQREKFLDSQIVTLKRDPSTGYCLNDNKTCYTIDSYLQEDGIVLMVNKISQVADAYGKTLIARYHTRALETAVQEELTLTLSNRLRVGTDNGPVSITVVCDSSNNPQSLINQRKIRIDVYATFTRTIRDVLIYSSILPTSE